MTTLSIIYDESAGFWTGRPWLEGEPAKESFRTEAEALEFIAGQTLAENASAPTDCARQ